MRKMNSKKLFSGIVTMGLFLSMGMTVLAASATSSFIYNQKTVNCVLNVDWKLGAYILAFDNNGSLVGSDNITAFDTAKTKTLSYTASKFKSTHNIQNSNRVPLESRNLEVKN